MPNGPKPEPTMSVTAFYRYLAVGVVAGVLVGYYAVDAIMFSLSSDRRIHFYVVNGKVDKDSPRINRFFRITEMPEGTPIPAEGEVFGFPYVENSQDPYLCFYNVGGVPLWKAFPTPPVPPCPK